MTFPKISFALGVLLEVVLLPGQPLFATATIVISNLDGPGEGFNDPTAVAQVGGNPGVTRGAQRLNVFNRAAAIWGLALRSNVTIVVEANFDPLFCTATSAVLGSAGPNTVLRDFPGANKAGTWYVQALANSLAGVDLSAFDDVGAMFNSDVDGDPNCLGGKKWYYGYDHNEGGSIDFLAVVLHEFGHGLGFLTLVNEDTGAEAAGFPDIFAGFMLDTDTAKNWVDMTDAERAASAINTKAVVWDGPAVAGASGFLTAGRIGSNPMLYTPSPTSPGSSLSHWATNATPSLLMEPAITAGLTDDLDLTDEALVDIGWTRSPVGACCAVADNQCSQVTEATCKLRGKGFAYRGDGTPCGSDGTCIPTVSQWGLAVLTLLVLTAATLVIMRRRGRFVTT